MTDQRAILASIATEPDDELNRLAYADWLEEHDDNARAEFIRLQCNLARDEKDEHLGPGERPALKAREKELIAAHGRQWAGVAVGFEPEFRRGFVERVSLEIKDVATGMERFQELRTAMPTIAGLKIAPSQGVYRLALDWMECMLRHEACRGLRELDLEGVRVGEDSIWAIAGASKPALERLNLRGCSIQEWDPLEALAASSYLGRLRELNLADNTILIRRQAALDSKFPSLEVLNLKNNALDDTMLRNLVRAPFMRRLRQLQLGENETLGNGAVTILAGSAEPLALRRLGLGNCHITDDGAAALADSAQFAQLESLSLGYNEIQWRGAQALAASPHLGKLKTLEIMNTDIGNEGLQALIASQALGGLKNLDASNINSFGAYDDIPLDTAAVARLAGLARLRSLKLENNDINAQSLTALLASPHLGELQELSLAGNPIRTGGARALAASPLDKLQSLNLNNCKLGVMGTREIAECSRFEELRHLDIGNNPLTTEFATVVRNTVGAVGKMPLGLRTQLERDDPRHVTVRR